MAETGETGSETVTRTPEVRAQEVGVVARKMVTERAAQAAAILKPVDQLTETEGALRLINKLQTDQDPKLHIGDDSIKLKEFSIGDFNFGKNEASVAQIDGTTDDGRLVCYLRKDGDIVMKPDGSGPQSFDFSRDDVIDAQIFSEQNRLLVDFQGDDKSLLRTHVDALPQNPSPARPGAEVDAVIDQAAEKHGVLKVTDVQAFVDGLTDEQKADPNLDAALKSLKGSKIVSAEQFSNVIALAGHDQDSLSEKVDAFQADIDKLEEDKGAVADDDPDKDTKRDQLQQQIDDVQKKKGGFDKAHKTAKDEADAEDVRVAAELQAQDEARQRRETPEADTEIASQVRYLQGELNAENAKDPQSLSIEDRKVRDERIKFLKAQLGGMQLASLANGEAGAFFKLGAIEAAIAREGVGSQERAALEGIRDGLREKAGNAKNYLRDLIDNSGEDPAKIGQFKAILEGNSGDLAQLLSSADFGSIKGFVENTFGTENFSGDEARRIDQLKTDALMNIADGAGLTGEQKSRLLKIAQGGMWAALVAALLAVGATALVMTGAAKAAGGQR